MLSLKQREQKEISGWNIGNTFSSEKEIMGVARKDLSGECEFNLLDTTSLKWRAFFLGNQR